jgi:hypothetical protein
MAGGRAVIVALLNRLADETVLWRGGADWTIGLALDKSSAAYLVKTLLAVAPCIGYPTA